ncbi:MAG: GNAT family N-acetyltransferase [Chryseobacterium jejuense]|uniref:GNAT family N-acetyltransferase n=1 Tax=Chryseobacterium jejuense TaxID=445960 RepID=UPI003D0DF559
MIQLKTLNKKQLEDFVSSGEFKQYDFLPITEHRAFSHIHNPKATDEQTLLILAFYEGKLAGYMGCLPDYFDVEEAKIRFAWLSTLYVSNEFRGKKVAKALLQKALDEYNNHVIMAEFTKEAEIFFNHIGNVENIFPKNGKRYYFRLDFATVLSEKKSWIKTFSPFLTFLDNTVNTFIGIKNIRIEKPNFRFEVLNTMDADIKNFVSSFNSQRNADEINYFTENPWVLEGRKRDDNYFFSSYAEVFKYVWVKIYDDQGNLETASLLLLRDGHLKVHYMFSTGDPGLNRFIQFLNIFVIQNKIKMMTIYSETINQKIKESASLLRIYEKDFKRDYLFRKELLKNLPKNFNPHLQDGDGDCMMT